MTIPTLQTLEDHGHAPAAGGGYSYRLVDERKPRPWLALWSGAIATLTGPTLAITVLAHPPNTQQGLAFHVVVVLAALAAVSACLTNRTHNRANRLGGLR